MNSAKGCRRCADKVVQAAVDPLVAAEKAIVRIEHDAIPAERRRKSIFRPGAIRVKVEREHQTAD